MSESITACLPLLQKKILAKGDANWTFNVNEMRPFTYQELFERRDEIRFPEQTFAMHLSPERQVRWEEIKMEGIEAERKKRTGEDLETEAERMNDDELYDIIVKGGVVIDEAEVDGFVKDQMEQDEEFRATMANPKSSRKIN